MITNKSNIPTVSIHNRGLLEHGGGKNAKKTKIILLKMVK